MAKYENPQVSPGASLEESSATEGHLKDTALGYVRVPGGFLGSAACPRCNAIEVRASTKRGRTPFTTGHLVHEPSCPYFSGSNRRARRAGRKSRR